MDAEEYLQPHPPDEKFVDDGDSTNGGSSNLSSELNSNPGETKSVVGMDHLCHAKDTSLSTRYCCDPLHPDSGAVQREPAKDVPLQVDEEDYLVPSPRACHAANYMDLVPDAGGFPFGLPQAVDNLEYHLVKASRDDEEPEYYNDVHQRELQPLNHRSETTV